MARARNFVDTLTEIMQSAAQVPTHMIGSARRLLQNRDGQDLAEYGIGLAIISVFMIIAVFIMQADLQTIWDNLSGAVSNSASQLEN